MKNSGQTQFFGKVRRVEGAKKYCFARITLPCGGEIQNAPEVHVHLGNAQEGRKYLPKDGAIITFQIAPNKTAGKCALAIGWREHNITQEPFSAMGQIDWFKADRGFGFMIVAHSRIRAYVALDDVRLKDGTIPDLVEGQWVECVIKNPKIGKYHATQVQIIAPPARTTTSRQRAS